MSPFDVDCDSGPRLGTLSVGPGRSDREGLMPDSPSEAGGASATAPSPSASSPSAPALFPGVLASPGLASGPSPSTRVRGLCPHGKPKHGYHCVECPGKGICEHGRRRNICKECGGASICEHGRNRQYCKECGGASICTHGRRRDICKECNGTSICMHDKIRHNCRSCEELRKNGMCEHEQLLNECERCKMRSYCVHGKKLKKCMECRGEGRGGVTTTALCLPVEGNHGNGEILREGILARFIDTNEEDDEARKTRRAEEPVPQTEERHRRNSGRK